MSKSKENLTPSICAKVFGFHGSLVFGSWSLVLGFLVQAMAKKKRCMKTQVKRGAKVSQDRNNKAYVYGRVSSKKQIDGTGFPRQKQAALQRAKLVVGKGKNITTCNEVVTGTKPVEQRKILGTLMINLARAC